MVPDEEQVVLYDRDLIQTHTYQVTDDTFTGQLAVWRGGTHLGSWADTTPLTSGAYLSLRTDNADVSFDGLNVLSVVKYYTSGGQRIALRRAGTVSYLLTDQLGSTRVTTSDTGAQTAEMKYHPFGWTRYNSGGQKTTYRFTGQRFGPGGGGLYDYGARWYDSYLNRWIQPDTIVPDLYNPQSLNRYSYVLNNPLRYTDPTGHAQACADGDEGGGCGHAATPAQVLATVFDSHLMDLYLWSYMRTHLSYDPASDPALKDDASRFIAANAQFQVLVSPLRPTDPTIDIKPLLAAGGVVASFAVPLDPPNTHGGNAWGGKIHSRYADGTPVYEGQVPPKIKGPRPEAQGPHSVLRWDETNNRLY